MNTYNACCAELKAIATPMYNDSVGSYFNDVVKDAFYYYNNSASKRTMVVCFNNPQWNTPENVNVLLLALDEYIIERIEVIIKTPY